MIASFVSGFLIYILKLIIGSDIASVIFSFIFLILDTLTTLDECKSKIETACSYTVSQADNTTIQACKARAVKLRSDLLECTKKKSEEAGCTCVNTITTTSAEMIICRHKTLPASKNAISNRTACINGKHSSKLRVY